MAKKKDDMECRWCHAIMTHEGPCCDEHREALAKQSFNLCAVCDKYFDTKKELCEHSHKEAA